MWVLYPCSSVPRRPEGGKRHLIPPLGRVYPASQPKNIIKASLKKKKKPLAQHHTLWKSQQPWATVYVNHTWAKIVPIQMPMKMGFVQMPEKMLCWLWILRAFTSLNKVMKTNVLKIIVKCIEGGAWTSSISLMPSSTSNSLGPGKKCRYKYLWSKRNCLCIDK